MTQISLDTYLTLLLPNTLLAAKKVQGHVRQAIVHVTNFIRARACKIS